MGALNSTPWCWEIYFFSDRITNRIDRDIIKGIIILGNSTKISIITYTYIYAMTHFSIYDPWHTQYMTHDTQYMTHDTLNHTFYPLPPWPVIWPLTQYDSRCTIRVITPMTHYDPLYTSLFLWPTTCVMTHSMRHHPYDTLYSLDGSTSKGCSHDVAW